MWVPPLPRFLRKVFERKGLSLDFGSTESRLIIARLTGRGCLQGRSVKSGDFDLRPAPDFCYPITPFFASSSKVKERLGL